MAQKPTDVLHGANAWYAEQILESYLEDPENVSDDWRQYFDALIADDISSPRDVPHGPIIKLLAQRQKRSSISSASNLSEQNAKKQVTVLQLINAYRFRGHRRADLDPLRQHQRPEVPELEPQYHGLTDDDMGTIFNTGSLFGMEQATLAEIIDTVRTTYCRTIGAEYMHIDDTEQKRWLQERLETHRACPNFTNGKKKDILKHVIAAESLEEYLHTKYVGQKRFSLEGGESLIPLLDELVEESTKASVKEVVIGMAHRGRLNVLVNTLGKRPSDLFDEFEGKAKLKGSGDVKYHMGYSSDIGTDHGNIHMSLAFNPSHLEIIAPVVEGSVRARQERRGIRHPAHEDVLPILLHGDAAFAGQGVVMETFNLSQTRGYKTGGTLHIVINNQIGFTTSDPLDSRSSLYCTDVAKMVQAPILHVNGSDPEAVVMVAKMALDYRNTFSKDIVIDMVCFRKHGHSEADEPMATQPWMYQRIRQHPGVCSQYSEQLIHEGVVTSAEIKQMTESYTQALDQNQSVSKHLMCEIDNRFHIDYSPYLHAHWSKAAKTSIGLKKLQELTKKCTSLPDNFSLHRSVQKIIKHRQEMGDGDRPIDWGMAETLAYASLLDEGHTVRVSGQDSGRGTFFHRHAELHNQNHEEIFVPLDNLGDDQPRFRIINSTLSEEAVLAFEYGYSASSPETLVIWEAQFGDFANGAQVVIDQFISSGVAKWGRHCGLVLLLPHGYDGQGPEHSSARLERYLQLCAEENMQVCFPSTPAQIFHILRRQILRPYRRPLVIMSPKSLLRHRLCTSTRKELTHGRFRPILPEIDEIDTSKAERVVICCGKVYYDLLESRREKNIDNIAIIRLEQLYPFPRKEMTLELSKYPNANDIVWLQEEPRNQGSWVYLLARNHLYGCLNKAQQLSLIGRPYSASPACGSYAMHLQQQNTLVSDALDLSIQTSKTDQPRRPNIAVVKS